MSATDDVTLTRQQLETLVNATLTGAQYEYPDAVCKVLADLFGTCHATYGGGMFCCEQRMHHSGDVHRARGPHHYVQWDDELSDDTTAPPAGDRTHFTNRQEA